jgi:hypothetical protein
VDLSLNKMIGDRLQRIANVLLLNASFLDNPGLLNGKMGIAIFFYHYSRFTKNKIYENFAGVLVDEIYEEINTSTPVNFENGLTGIGWGIEYLVKNGFVQADTDEALSEIDNYVSRSMMSYAITSENCNDLAGYGFYYPSRLGLRCIDEESSVVKGIVKCIKFFTDYIERVIVGKEIAGFDLYSLTEDTICSLIWFLLQTQRLGFSSEPAFRIFSCISEHVEQLLKSSSGPFESNLRLMVESFVASIPDDLLKSSYSSISVKGNSNTCKSDTIVEILIKNTWLELICNPYSNETRLYRREKSDLFSLIDIEDYWERQLDKLNSDNLGLKGWAGLGFSILKII